MIKAVQPIEGRDKKFSKGFCPYCGEVIGLDIASLKRHAKIHGLPDEAWLS